ncbi:MAG: paraquat-inducible protein A [Bdellovibrionota bacterium]
MLESAPKPFVLYALLIGSLILFGCGLFGPCLTITPQFGELTGILKIIKPSFDAPQTLSVATGIRSMWEAGEHAIALIILAFSIVFPLWKYSILWACIAGMSSGEIPFRELRRIEHLGKFSMLDVYVLAVSVVAIKQLPGGSSVHLGWGLYAFAGAVLMTLPIPGFIERAAGSAISGKAE